MSGWMPRPRLLFFVPLASVLSVGIWPWALVFSATTESSWKKNLGDGHGVDLVAGVVAFFDQLLG